jgi:hypothetical protein
MTVLLALNIVLESIFKSKVFYYICEGLSNPLSTSSSSASLHQVQQSKPLIKLAQAANKVQPESVIRIVCYFLCVNKNHVKSHGAFIDNLKLEHHLSTINQMIEDALSIYKREIFWDNLTLALESSQSSPTPSVTTTTSATHLFNCFSIQHQELEYILYNSYKINAVDLDQNLAPFLKQIFKLKDKIVAYFQQNFDKFFFYVQSNHNDYCILLLSNGLMSTLNDQIQSNSRVTSDEKDLNTFILIKFDKVNKVAELLKVNRLEQSQDTSAFEATTSAQLLTAGNMDLHASRQKMVLSQSNMFDYSKKHFAFIINTLIYIVWENLF